MIKNVKWGDFKLSELFEIEGTKSLDSNAIEFTKSGINYIGRTFEDNGIQGKILKRDFEPNEPNTITATVIGNYKYVKYQIEPYYCSQNINKLTPKSIIPKWNKKIAYYFIASIQKYVSLYDGQQGGYKLEDINNHSISIPIINEKIDIDFMELYIDMLEKEQLIIIDKHLESNGLKDYNLSDMESKALENFEYIKWNKFNLKNLFGKSTRGKRLKSEDRIDGSLPFITAGETNEGLSSFIGNDVAVFPSNTTTIDMFGSAKYRNYQYGGDDHIAVVHTENLSKYASVFVTSAIHKSSYNGQFNYGRNFYAKDADALDISLPVKDGKPDYEVMETILSAIHKLVIKDVVHYVKNKLKN